VVGVLVGPVAMMVLPPATAGAPLLLPDLRQAAVGCYGGYTEDVDKCRDWDVCMVADPDAPNGECIKSGRVGAVRLRFTSAEDNVGDGPLLLFGQRDPESSTMRVRQGFQSGRHGPIPQSYAEARLQTLNSMYYETAPLHQHWHLMEFERLQLRSPNGRTVVSDRKNGFCLGDRYRTRDQPQNSARDSDTDTPEYRLAEYLQDNVCAYKDPSATEVKVGISVGSGDDYAYDVDFQWLDITRVPSGVYDLVNTVNANRTLHETNYNNNSSSMAISLKWPGRSGQPPAEIKKPPTVSLLRNCPGEERCADGAKVRPRISSDQIYHPERHRGHH
jgi:Lysyl oxidase